ncbi:Asp23/Gls24 family envelope stress response protein [Streptomyces sp. G44]|uniref:Asp23/Gls24 family envelope stress response protein n=1 Tax=Streptomyces sp. G44 TaxID=2807632 RepID=UPI0019608F14|nr:Asp23/Gls24 family envelope stress response protein [Streptomyces sp. G44]MBM7172096.1 Asp23/Gls24 family envelope stress response protein [Streptomyces sp. G44]
MAVNEETGPGEARETATGGNPPEGLAEREPLPCGRELWSVWEGWESGEPDPHADTCPHCAGALDTLRRLEDVVSAARAAEPREREEEAEASALVGRVMDVVRLELRPGRTLPLGDEEEDAWIVEAAAARTVRAAAETLPGVRAGSCRIEVRPRDDAPPAPAGRRSRDPVRIRLEVQVALTWNLQEVAERVRHRVLEAADAELGMPVATVDVTIGDIIADTADTADTDDITAINGIADSGDDIVGGDGTEGRRP